MYYLLIYSCLEAYSVSTWVENAERAGVNAQMVEDEDCLIHKALCECIILSDVS